jgi:hypothetical protein
MGIRLDLLEDSNLSTSYANATNEILIKLMAMKIIYKGGEGSMAILELLILMNWQQLETVAG